MGIMRLDSEAKAELHSEAEKLIARYDSPLETVKALMAYNCELETQIVALAHRHPWFTSATTTTRSRFWSDSRGRSREDDVARCMTLLLS